MPYANIKVTREGVTPEQKAELIKRHNPTWRDLFDDAVRMEGFEP